jgi:hypothetical protein
MPEYDLYLNRYVRDLAWVIASPPLLSVPATDVTWFDGQWYLKAWQRAQCWLAELEKDPSPLELHCRSFCANNPRLGRYFEALLAYWFSHDPCYELLQHDLQIHNAGQTLGALDFIIRVRASNVTLHVEAAVKYYLGTGAGGGWRGPSREDSLQHKFTHLSQTQSRLSHHPVVRQALKTIGINIDSSAVMLKGRLFYPAAEQQSSPSQACTGHLQGQWWLEDVFFQHFSGQSWHWHPLKKTDWLSDLKNTDRRSSLTLMELKQDWDQQPLHQPCCLAATDLNGNEGFRVFVVPAGWYG